MSEVLFYHLERQSLEALLANLLEKTLERGWRAVVEAPSRERIEALDAHLWTYRDDSFLPHGLDDGPHADSQPILLTTGEGAANAAEVRFIIDGADPRQLEAHQRAVLIFDGRDDEAVALARRRWKELKASSHALTYWQQDEQGRWVKKG